MIKPVKILIVAIVILITFVTLLKSLIRNDNLNDIFENIINAELQPENGQNVFFIDTKETTKNVILSARQACAIESSALANPHLKVFFLFSSRERLNNLKLTPEVGAILSYPNVHINYLNMNEISSKSPMESFLKTRRLAKSSFKIEHTSDVLRLLLLWKYGGTYLDLDMIVKKKLDSIASNYACVQDISNVNGAILNFDTIKGKELAEIFIEGLIANFNGDKFATNGPGLITSVLEGLCKVNVTMMVQKKECEGFHVHPQKVCYPIPFQSWQHFMDEKFANDVMEKTRDSMVVHFWNKLSHVKKIKMDSNAAYIQLARKFCPITMENLRDFF